MKKWIGSIVVLLTVLFVGGCGANTVQPDVEPDTPSNIEETKHNETTSSNKKETETVQEKQDVQNEAKQLLDAPVEKVVDGDTIKVKIGQSVETVRFLLVDTPETSHPKLGKQPFGQEAKDFVINLLEGKTVQLEKDVGERDKYGRLLMYVYIDGKSVQEELLRNGLARVAYVYAPNTKYVDRYYEIQKEAQNKAVGIWSVENYATDKGFNSNVIEEKQEDVSFTTPSAKDSDCNIKGNINSKGDKIYHVPGGAFYESTDIDTSKGERYFCSKEEAEANGWRASQR